MNLITSDRIELQKNKLSKKLSRFGYSAFLLSAIAEKNIFLPSNLNYIFLKKKKLTDFRTLYPIKRESRS